jgi:hypothetical protein
MMGVAPLSPSWPIPFDLHHVSGGLCLLLEDKAHGSFHFFVCDNDLLRTSFKR